MKKKPIDGNQIINNIRQNRINTPVGSGVIKDSVTGKVLASAFNSDGQESEQKVPTKMEMQSNAYDDIERNEIYAREEYDGGGEYGPSYEELEDYATYTSDNTDGPGGMTEDYQADMTGHPGFENDRTELLNRMGDISNFMEDNKLSFDDILNMMPEEVSDEDIKMLRDPRKIRTQEDRANVDMAFDRLLDSMNVDAEKYFQEGIIEDCGDECKARRMNMSNPLQEEDDQFMEKYAMLGE